MRLDSLNQVIQSLMLHDRISATTAATARIRVAAAMRLVCLARVRIATSEVTALAARVEPTPSISATTGAVEEVVTESVFDSYSSRAEGSAPTTSLEAPLEEVISESGCQHLGSSRLPDRVDFPDDSDADSVTSEVVAERLCKPLCRNGQRPNLRATVTAAAP